MTWFNRIQIAGASLAFIAASTTAQTAGIGAPKVIATAHSTAAIATVIPPHAGGLQFRTKVLESTPKYILAADAGSDGAAVIAYIKANMGDTRSEMTEFLRNRDNIPEAAFNVRMIYYYKAIRSTPAGQVVHIQYEVRVDRRETEVRESDFVMRLKNGGIKVVDILEKKS
jgi:hypothetical protein